MSDSLDHAALADRLRSYLQRAAALQHVATFVPPDLDRPLDQADQLTGPSHDVMTRASSQRDQSTLDPTRLRHMISILSEPIRSAPPLRPALDVWSVSGLKRDELRNAAVLAWLLHPNGSHGFGPAVLHAFLDEVAKTAVDWPRLTRDFSRVSVLTEEWPLGSETDRVDIAIDGPDFTLFVEVKIGAPEGPDQLLRYAKLVRQKAQALKREHARVIYLSPRPPRDPPRGVAIITWRQVAGILSALPREGLSGMLTTQFARHICAFF